MPPEREEGPFVVLQDHGNNEEKWKSDRGTTTSQQIMVLSICQTEEIAKREIQNSVCVFTSTDQHTIEAEEIQGENFEADFEVLLWKKIEDENDPEECYYIGPILYYEAL